jgi:DNA-binding response OmpR family regulator
MTISQGWPNRSPLPVGRVVVCPGVAVLIAEDDPEMASFIGQALRAAGFAVREAGDGVSALQWALDPSIELVILDLGLPAIDGEAVLAGLRAQRADLPVIVLTARDAVDSRVRVLEAGADDYVLKPFALAELLARVRARLRTAGQATGVVLDGAGVRLDVRAREVTVDGRRVELTGREFGVLEMLLRHRGQVISQMQLLESVWGYDFDPGSNVVEQAVAHVRRKVGSDVIQTVRGAGYRVR